VIAADEQEINRTAEELQAFGGNVEAVDADLATKTGVNKLISAARAYDKPVEALLANAGRGLGKGFLDQNFKDAKRVVETKITGTIYLIQQIGRDMRAHGRGRILVTGSIAGFMPGTFQPVYNGAKAFLDSFSFALRHELRDSGGSVTCPAEVAQIGFKAMQTGDGDVVAGWQNKQRAAIAHVLPADLLAEAHRAVAQPGSDQQ
jgi:short-subunit dehydrogenase